MKLVLYNLYKSCRTPPQLKGPDETASEKEKNNFQTALRDRLDIILTLYENVHKTFQGLFLFV